MEFRSRAVRSLVELHELELRRFLDTWERFEAAGASMPEALEDPSYASREHLVSHAAGAARGYLTWIGENVGRPVTDLDLSRDPTQIAPRVRQHIEETLAGWRRHLAVLADDELTPMHTSRWGEPYNVEQMLEHAVVHPMRHRIQLERILAGTGQPAAR